MSQPEGHDETLFVKLPGGQAFVECLRLSRNRKVDLVVQQELLEAAGSAISSRDLDRRMLIRELLQESSDDSWADRAQRTDPQRRVAALEKLTRGHSAPSRWSGEC